MSLWNNFEIIRGKLPCTEIKLFQTDIDKGWNNFISHVTTALKSLTVIGCWCCFLWLSLSWFYDKPPCHSCRSSVAELTLCLWYLTITERSVNLHGARETGDITVGRRVCRGTLWPMVSFVFSLLWRCYTDCYCSHLNQHIYIHIHFLVQKLTKRNFTIELKWNMRW